MAGRMGRGVEHSRPSSLILHSRSHACVQASHHRMTLASMRLRIAHHRHDHRGAATCSSPDTALLDATHHPSTAPIATPVPHHAQGHLRIVPTSTATVACRLCEEELNEL